MLLNELTPSNTLTWRKTQRAPRVLRADAPALFLSLSHSLSLALSLSRPLTAHLVYEKTLTP